MGETLALEGGCCTQCCGAPMACSRASSWEQRSTASPSGLQAIVDRDGPDAVAFYLSGQLLTEDYYVANKLMKGFIGSANVDTNSRLCMASSVAGHRRAFGADTVPGTYRDLDQADLIVLVGSNAAWCHPVLYPAHDRGQARARHSARRHRSAPHRDGEEADLFLPIAPGTDSALFCGLLVYLADARALDRRYIDAHTTGFAEALRGRATSRRTSAATARATAGSMRRTIARFFDLFRTTERVVTCFSQGVNQSAQGTDKVNAIINAHLATGRIGRPGMGPFSLTGQPNAMGGREVGGLANQLAAHMGFRPPRSTACAASGGRRAWRTREGLKAVDMFEAIERGEIKALWVMATNPAVSLPRAGCGARRR